MTNTYTEQFEGFEVQVYESEGFMSLKHVEKKIALELPNNGTMRTMEIRATGRIEYDYDRKTDKRFAVARTEMQISGNYMDTSAVDKVIAAMQAVQKLADELQAVLEVEARKLTEQVRAEDTARNALAAEQKAAADATKPADDAVIKTQLGYKSMVDRTFWMPSQGLGTVNSYDKGSRTMVVQYDNEIALTLTGWELKNFRDRALVLRK